MALSDDLDGWTYYHGTCPSSAVCIYEEGFRVPDRVRVFGDGALGTGVYLTQRMVEALFVGRARTANSTYVLRVELHRGTKIARLDEEPNPKVLDSLRREFGHEVLGPRFATAIPSNKHLKPRELFALIGHLEQSKVLFEERSAKQHVRKWLQRLGYDGYGHTANDLGVMLFNPSRILVRDIQRFPEQGNMNRPILLEVSPAELAKEAEDELFVRAEMQREDEEDPEYQADLETDAELRRRDELERVELEHRRSLLVRYRQRHGIA